MPRPDSKGKLVKPSFAARLGKITRQVERSARNTGIGPRPAPSRPVQQVLMLAKVTEAGGIKFGDSGEVTLYTDGSGSTLSSETRTVFNPHPSVNAPANSKCLVTNDRGVWIVAGWFC